MKLQITFVWYESHERRLDWRQNFWRNVWETGNKLLDLDHSFQSKEQNFADSEINADFQPRGRRERQPYDDKFYSQSVSHSMLTQKRRPVPDWQQRVDTIELFSGESIGIFEANMTESTDSPKLLIWDQLFNDELQYIIAQPPKNAFEEMIQWTEEGKLWKYPINNEQGLLSFIEFYFRWCLTSL